MRIDKGRGIKYTACSNTWSDLVCSCLVWSGLILLVSSGLVSLDCFYWSDIFWGSFFTIFKTLYN